jgi:hypothetical protein
VHRQEVLGLLDTLPHLAQRLLPLLLDELLATHAVSLGVLQLLAQTADLFLKTGDVLLVDVPRSLSRLPVFLFLDFGSLLFGEFVVGPFGGRGVGAGFFLVDLAFFSEALLLRLVTVSGLARRVRFRLFSHLINLSIP